MSTPPATAPATTAVGPAAVAMYAAANAAIAAEMRRDERVVLLGFEVAQRTGLRDEFGPRRVIDTPIAELAVTGLGVGAARRGLRPIVDLMGSSFFFLAMDQIANHAAVTRHLFGGELPMALVIRGITGVGDVPGGAHHGRMAHSLLAGVPGLTVVMAADAPSAAGLMTAAIRDPGPVVFLDHVALYRSARVLDGPTVRDLGQAVIRRPGTDVTVVGTGPTVVEALDAATTLAAEGIDAEVLDLCTVSPIDLDTIVRSVACSGRLVVADESPAVGSIANCIAAVVARRLAGRLRAPVSCVTAPHRNVPFSTAATGGLFLPDADRIAAEVRRVCR